MGKRDIKELQYNAKGTIKKARARGRNTKYFPNCLCLEFAPCSVQSVS